MMSTSVARVGVVVAVVVGLVFGGAIGYVAGEDHTSTRVDESSKGADPASVMFALRADSMTTTTNGSTSTVVLQGAEPTGDWFTDRPERRSGTEDLDVLLGGFFGEKAGTPPNATISGVSGGRGFLAAVELREPRWDSPTRTLTFTAVPLSDRDVGRIPAEATDVAVTVDALWQTCTIDIAASDGLLLQVSGYPEVIFGSNASLESGSPYFSTQPISVFQQGSSFYGCGGSVGVTVADPATPPTATEPGTEPEPIQMCSIEWSNPMNGANGQTIECSWNTPVQIVMISTPSAHTDTPVWKFVVERT